MRTQKKILTARLPVTPCTPEMRNRLVAMAEKRGTSLSEIQRQAITLFFAHSDTDCIGSETDSINGVLQEQAS